jgi:hypothetical protein
MYEIIAIERGLGYSWITIKELYVKLGYGRYHLLKSMFSEFNKKRLTRKLLDSMINNGIVLVYPELPKQSNIIYRYEV